MGEERARGDDDDDMIMMCVRERGGRSVMTIVFCAIDNNMRDFCTKAILSHKCDTIAFNASIFTYDCDTFS